MRRAVVLVAVALATAAAASKLHVAAGADHEVVVTEAFVAETNRLAAGKWTAGMSKNRHVEGATRKQLKALMGVKRRVQSSLPRKTFTPAQLAAIPASFDAATNWPDCPTITHIRDQSACGSCWAVAAAEAMSDRYCTGGGAKNLLLSALDMLSCCWYCGSGCEGGDPGMAWGYWVNTGLVSDACEPYPFPKCDHHTTTGPYPPCPSATYNTPACPATCTGSGNTTVYKGASSYALKGVADFQAELMAHGPFEVAFDVYSDFVTYTGGVYQRTSNDYLGGHAVKVVGWGELNGTPYWKIANSWNADWGLSGYFLILRGATPSECGIEDEGSAGLAQI